MEQINILLACAAGMSTSFIVSRMNETALNDPVIGRIWAVPVEDIEFEEDYQILLLGPQISSYYDHIRSIVPEEIPVMVIPRDLYGSCDGEAILKLALENSTSKKEPSQSTSEKKQIRFNALNVLQYAFRMIMPIVLLGSILTLITGFPLPVWQDFLINTGLKDVLSLPTVYIYGFFSVFLSFAIGYQSLRLNNITKRASVGGLFAVLTFLVLCPSDNVLEYIDQKGIFVAILAGLLTGFLYIVAENKDLHIRFSSAIPANIAESYDHVLPGGVSILIAVLVHALFAVTTYGSLQNAVDLFIRRPLSYLSANIFGQTALGLVAAGLWFFGIHGGHIISPVAALLFTNVQLENLEAYREGLIPPHQITGLSLSIGNGSLPLVLCMLLFAKSKTNRTTAKIAAIPSLFGIDEPAYFGFPMIMNRMFLIPWIFGNILVTNIGTYLLQNAGLLPNASAVSVGYFVPPFVTNLVLFGWRGVAWGFVMLAGLIALNYPFVKKYDRKLLEEEETESSVS